MIDNFSYHELNRIKEGSMLTTMTLTVRQQIVNLLQSKPMSAAGLARETGSNEKAIESHLPHVAKSVGGAFKMIPSECQDCGFIFSKRDRSTRPTKCPTCRSEHISEPLFFIKTP
jgi:transcriptional regulator